MNPNDHQEIASSETLLLIDGSSYLYRAYHALPNLTNSKGNPTGAIFGVTHMLRKILSKNTYEYIAIIFDAPGKTFRHEMYEKYKAHRPSMPEDLIAQIEPLHRIIRALGLPLLMVSGVEADDVIGTLAVEAEKKGISCLISTGDKDFAQLVNSKIALINTMSDTYLDRNGIIEKFGCPPEAIVDYLSIIGDTSDNITGVNGVGPKTAVKWLSQYKTLENLIAHVDELKGKVVENFKNFIPHFELNRKLVTIQTNVPLDISVEDLKPQTSDHQKLLSIFSDLEFKSWIKDLNKKLNNELEKKPDEKNTHLTPETPKRSQNYEIITNEAQFLNWIEKLKHTPIFSLDTETTSLNYIDAELVGCSFAVLTDQHIEAAYIPMAHDYDDAPLQLSREYVLAQLKPLLENPELFKIGHHIKYDMNIFANYNIHLQGIRYDTMLESYVYNSTATKHNLDALALKFLNIHTIHYEDVVGKGAKQILFSKVPIEEAGIYAAEDAEITYQLHQNIWPQMLSNSKIKSLYEDIEIPLIPVLAGMEQKGVLINAPMLQSQSEILEKKCAELNKTAYDLAGYSFNLSSSKQLQKILYEDLKYPILAKTPKGQPSTSEHTLQMLAYQFPLPKIILEYRSLIKLKTTYTDKLPLDINKKTGRIHTSYHQAMAATGRLSSSNPNLQNIPIRTEEGRLIRKAFIAPPGYKLVCADYSQIELRIIGHLSSEPALIDAFHKDLDIHTATAADVLGIPLTEVSSLQRRHAKAINFGLMYGMSAFGLAKQLGMDRSAAQNYINLYFQRYPQVKKFMEDIREQARVQGYVETLFGRRLYLPNINSKNFNLRNAAERAAINAPMQGTAADIIKRAMIQIDNWLKQDPVQAHMIMQVHDELIFEVLEKDVETVKSHVDYLMSHAAQLKVKLKVDIGVGQHWDEAH